jgi:hypothetical protein
MIADMHRARHLAWELPQLGWDVEVLAPNTQFQRPEFVESESTPMFNPTVPYHSVASDDPWYFRLLKIRTIAWRAYRPLKRAGRRLLAHQNFDLVYISTANFNLFCLGRDWSRRFGVPYVLDYHDPWVRTRIDFRTTRHKFKRLIGACLARWMEPYALTGAAGIVAVSPNYLQELRIRYGELPCLAADRCEAIPFAASENDFRAIGPAAPDSACPLEIAYVGAGGAIMAKAFLEVCRSLAEARQCEPALFEKLRIRLYGTSSEWCEGDPKPLEEIAARFGLAGLVEELPRRISYFRAMEISLRAAGLFVLGIDSPGYMPSKLFGYALTGRPLLASFRSDSPMAGLFQKLPALGHAIAFDAVTGGAAPNAVAVVTQFLREVGARRRFERKALLSDYLAPAMARRHVAIFESCLRGRR